MKAALASGLIAVALLVGIPHVLALPVYSANAGIRVAGTMSEFEARARDKAKAGDFVKFQLLIRNTSSPSDSYYAHGCHGGRRFRVTYRHETDGDVTAQVVNGMYESSTLPINQSDTDLFMRIKPRAASEPDDIKRCSFTWTSDGDSGEQDSVVGKVRAIAG